MAEAEINYLSVVFKSNQNPSSKVIKEETVYDEVKGQSKSSKQTSDPNDKKEEETVYDEVKQQHKTSEQSADTKVPAGFSQDSDKIDEETRRPHCQCLACCLGILCVILLSGIIAMMVHQRNITNLTAQNQELESQRDNLTQQIRDMETKWKEDNVTRAQWSIDQYCPKDNNRRTCKACQQGWNNNQFSCYAVNNAERSDQKTWEEARENCTGKNSDLAVIVNEAQKKFTTDNSWKQAGISGYWIGLKVEDGRWKWVDGTNLTNDLWNEPPVNGRCATSLQSQGWRSVNCTDKNAWICGKKALSV
ncbi:killer cell lectin-like receptor subfamily B member 1B allele A isoform X2 [Channa argus]|uniref:killer cell lectin-like receptor subfamily B member 1B allele A isoform X2 n=1 Tax=Channa argus TaxID=215402 RepID=UPI0035228141